MSQAPSMPMFWDAYLADTTHLSTEEHGAYLLLLAAMWRRNGSVPDDDRDNARIVGMTPAKWRRTKDRLGSLLIVENGEITQKNLRKIWEITQEKIRKNRENGAQGGRPKSNKNNEITKANGFVSDNPNETIPEPEPDIKKEEPKGSSKESANEAEGNDDETRDTLDVGNGSGGQSEQQRDAPARKAKTAAGKPKPICEDREPAADELAIAEQHGLDAGREWPRFVNYWIQQEHRAAGRKTERGWRAAWRNWCSKAAEFAERDRRESRSGREVEEPMGWGRAFELAIRAKNGNGAGGTVSTGESGGHDEAPDSAGQVLPFRTAGTA